MTASQALPGAQGSCGVTPAIRPLPVGEPWHVAWTGAEGCLAVAELLADGVPVLDDGHGAPDRAGLRCDLLVTDAFSESGLVCEVVPLDVDPSRVDSVTAIVDDGPDAYLVAAVADRMAAALGVPAEVATAYRRPDELPGAITRIERIASSHSAVGRRIAHASSLSAFAATLGPRVLLVTGAGAANRAAGVMVVRSASRRPLHTAGACRYVERVTPVAAATAELGSAA